MSLDDVSKVTKIQPRILERLEAGKLDGLPADVFVRGFVRSFARCVGLEEAEALRRYAACGLSVASSATGSVTGAPGAGEPTALGSMAGGTDSQDLAPAARALVEAMAELVPSSASRATPRRPITVIPEESEVRLATGSLVEVIDLAAGTLSGLRAPTAPVVAALDPADATPDDAAPVASEPASRPSVATIAPAPVAAAASVSIPAAASTPVTASTAVAMAPVATTIAAPHVGSAGSLSKKKRRRAKRDRRASGAPSRESLAMGTPVNASPVVAAPDSGTAAESTSAPAGSSAISSSAAALDAGASDVAASSIASGTARTESTADSAAQLAASALIATSSIGVDSSTDAVTNGTADAAPIASATTSVATTTPTATTVATSLAATPGTWSPRMPAATPSVPWRRPAYPTAAATATLVPSLVIDDADPDSAERVIEEREEKHAMRRSFLPPILLDREDRSTRQGGLTLAVILLLIAATLTLSYLMRRPTAGGDGMTSISMPASDLG